MAKYDELYKELLDRCKEVNIIGSCAGLLGWDERTYMPRAGAASRATQISYLSGLAHEKFVDPRIGELLAELEQSPLVKEPLSDSAVNIREIRHEYDKSVKVPKELVEELSHTRTMAQGVWAEARKESNFPKFLPWLDKIIKLDLRLADCYGYKRDPYDALLDNYEPGATFETIGKVLADFRKDLIPIVAAIIDSPKKPDLSIIERDYPVERQAMFGQSAAAAIGFDFSAGRLDITTHPFCSGIAPGDTRITTRYNPRHFGQAFFGILHETGHGIYDQGLKSEHWGAPLGDSVSLGIHESQSRMWENLVGRSRPFWRHFFPRAQQMFPESLQGVKFDDFYFAINDVRPSFIRVEADEVTYNLHIILRFEIEHAFLNGEVKPSELPGLWNEKFQQFFGIVPRNDADGCLQDVHWSMGYIGYFPTYTLGNLYSAQFFAKAKQDIKDLDEQFARGEFMQLKSWLNKNIHEHGKRYRAEKLVEVVTGKPLSHQPLINYLKSKFGELYGI
jgi:carboxypeptidase Taq